MPKKGCLGCSFPLGMGVLVVVLVLFVVGVASGPLGAKMLPGLAASGLVTRRDSSARRSSSARPRRIIDPR